MCTSCFLFGLDRIGVDVPSFAGRESSAGMRTHRRPMRDLKRKPRQPTVFQGESTPQAHGGSAGFGPGVCSGGILRESARLEAASRFCAGRPDCKGESSGWWHPRRPRIKERHRCWCCRAADEHHYRRQHCRDDCRYSRGQGSVGNQRAGEIPVHRQEIHEAILREASAPWRQISETDVKMISRSSGVE